MATIIAFILNGTEYTQPRQARDLKVLATFDGDSVQANITTSVFNFVDVQNHNGKNGKANTAIRNWFNTYPTEGMPLTINIEGMVDGDEIVISENYYLQFENYRILSDSECEITVQKENGLVSLDDRANGVSMLLMKNEGVLGTADWVRVPYVVENRKTLLEFIVMQMQLASIGKSIYDETFKLVNIVGDILSIGAYGASTVIALVNLIATIANLILLTIQLVKLLIDMQQAFFPMVRYHLGINVKNWIVKSLDYLGYGFATSSSFEEILDRVTLLGSKNDEIGVLAAAVEFGDLGTVTLPPLSTGGILKPNDFGYTLGETLELLNKMFYTKVAVIDGVVHVRPFNDPFWTQSPSYVFPNVLIEKALDIDNGSQSFNVKEMVSRTLIEYTSDDSDLHTLTDVNNSTAEVIYKPISVVNQKHVNIRGLDKNTIPYALCVRKDASDALFGFFGKLEDFYAGFKSKLESIYDKYPILEATPLAEIVEFLAAIFVRAGAMKVENHFFSTPKIVYLDPTTGRIPKNFTDIIGARALWTNYHSYKSLVQGDKNPSDLTDTNQKLLYDKARIPFGIKDYQQTINNSFFEYQESKTGRFTRIEWDVYRDSADVDFYVFDIWNNNLQSELV